MTRILLTGKNGQVGWELQRTLATLGEVIALDRHGMDLANPDSIRRAIRDNKPNLIVNAAAYTAVDKAETEPELAMAINGVAPGIIAEEAKKLGAGVVHYSTDYVFDGSKSEPYTEEDAPNPINAYGKTKLAGERAVLSTATPCFILRTSWVYGLRGRNFMLTILRLAREREELRIVDDQVGAPTWCRDISETTARIISRSGQGMEFDLSHLTEAGGIYHLSAMGQTSWFNFAKAALEYVSRDRSGGVARLIPIPATEFVTPAKRPKNSLMSNRKLSEAFNITMPFWTASLERCLSEMAL